MRYCIIIVTAAFTLMLGGCITLKDEPITPHTEQDRYSQTIPDRSDDMLRVCKDTKRNRRDRNCVITESD